MTQHFSAQKTTAERNVGLTIQNRALLLRVAELEKQLAIAQAKNDNSKKLTKSEVTQIRRLWQNRGNVPITQREIADSFQVNSATVSRIVHRKYHAALA